MSILVEEAPATLQQCHPHSDDSCMVDHCEVLEHGLSRTPSDEVQVHAPDMHACECIQCLLDLCARLERPETQEWQVLSGVPLGESPWQFVRRAAAPPRAP